MNLIILAGGKSSRFGKDKAFVKFKGVPIIERLLSGLGPLFAKVIVVTNRPAAYAGLKCRVVADQYKNIGPLGGLQAGLAATDAKLNFVIACDMPQIVPRLVKFLIGFKGYAAVVPVVKGFPEPLCALYSKDCLPEIETLIKEGIFKINRLYGQVKTRFVPSNVLKRYDSEMISFLNINDQRTLQKHERKN